MKDTVTPARTVADLVVERPARARLFEELGIDYCCGGKRPLGDACRSRGLDVDVVLAALAAGEDAPRGTAHAVEGMTAAELCDHVVAVHHGFLRAELPRLAGLVEKVARAHGPELPEIGAVGVTFASLRSGLEEHLEDEERRVFPLCRRAARDRTAAAALREALGELESEHVETGALLGRLSELTGGYETANARCNTHRAMLDGLAALARDVHLHVHEENNLLFPRVLAAAAA